MNRRQAIKAGVAAVLGAPIAAEAMASGGKPKRKYSSHCPCVVKDRHTGLEKLVWLSGKDMNHLIPFAGTGAYKTELQRIVDEKEGIGRVIATN